VTVEITPELRTFLDTVEPAKRRRDEETLLGPHTSGVGCLYLKDLEQVDLAVLKRIVASSHRTLTSGTYGARAAEGTES